MPDAVERLNEALTGRYRIERELGAGGMATVWLAEDLRHDRKVALKVLKPELTAVLGADRFIQEIKTTASLQHPHILPLFDSGSAAGFLFYVMPYVEGETLRDKLNRETQLGIDEAVRITCEVADALDYAHRRGIVHRDIKPENILLHDGRPMVADFGIALAVSAAAGGRMTETGTSVGTPHYMSPEQATADREITARADVYSLASVLYEMLTGSPPHVGSSAQQVIMKIITDVPRPVTELRRNVAPNVAAALAQALEKLPADRFDTARAFAEALADPHFAVTGAAAATAAGTGSAPAVRRFLPWGVAAAGLALGLFGLLSLLSRADAGTPGPPLRAALLFPADSGPANRGFALSPDERELAWVTSPGLDGARIWIRSLETGATRVLPGTEDALAPAWSPDGSRIAFRVGETDIRVVPAEGGPVTNVARVPTGAGIPGWAADGTLLFAVRPAGFGVVEAGNRMVLLPVPDSLAPGMRQAPTPLVEGRTFLFAVSDARSGPVYRGDLATGTFDRLGNGNQPWYVDGTLVSFRIADPVARRFDLATAEGGPETVLAVGVASPFGWRQLAIRGRTLVYAPQRPDMYGKPLFWWTPETGAVPGPGPFEVQGWMFGLSRDGARIAIGGFGLWVLDTAPGAIARRIEAAGEMAGHPRWSEDGRTILYVASDGLYAVGTGTADVPKLLVPLTGVSFDGTRAVGWGPDGSVLFVHTAADGTSALEAADPDGTRRVVQPGATNAHLSPDGAWLAYASAADGGRSEIYVRAWSGEGQPVRVSRDGGNSPWWSPRGDRLYFATANGRAMVSSLSFAGGVSASPPASLDVDMPLRTYSLPLAVMPDGRLLLNRDEPSLESLQLIRDWKGLLGGGGE